MNSGVEIKERAKAFAMDVRSQIVAYAGHPTVGVKTLPIAEQDQIRNRADFISRVTALKPLSDSFNQSTAFKLINNIALNFQEFCHRQKIKIPEELKEALMPVFLEELMANARAFGYEDNPAKVKSLTLYNGDSCIGYDAEDEFCEFTEHSPWVFRYFVANNPKDPREALRRVQRQTDRVMQDKKFESFHDYPGLVRRVAINNPSNVEDKLSEIQRKVK